MESDTMNIQTKITELSKFFNTEYIVIDSSNQIREIHGNFNTISIDGNNINSISINDIHIQFILYNGTKFYLNFKEFPIITNL
jgi:sensor histidine kinase regulating citrate/malate metabolism